MWLINNEAMLQKESEEAINLDENNPNENQTIVQETIHDKADQESQGRIIVPIDANTYCRKRKVTVKPSEYETTVVLKKAKEEHLPIEYIDIKLTKHRSLPGDKFGMEIFCKGFSY